MNGMNLNEYPYYFISPTVVDILHCTRHNFIWLQDVEFYQFYRTIRFNFLKDAMYLAFQTIVLTLGNNFLIPF